MLDRQEECFPAGCALSRRPSAVPAQHGSCVAIPSGEAQRSFLLAEDDEQGCLVGKADTGTEILTRCPHRLALPIVQKEKNPEQGALTAAATENRTLRLWWIETQALIWVFRAPARRPKLKALPIVNFLFAGILQAAEAFPIFFTL